MLLRASVILFSIGLWAALATPAGAQPAHGDLEAPGPMDRWLWVVPHLDAEGPGHVAAFYAGHGRADLTVALVDGQGEVVARGRWELVAGRPADYDLHDLTGQGPENALALLISGLEARPDRLALSLRREGPDGTPRDLPGTWLRSDPAWLPSLENAP